MALMALMALMGLMDVIVSIGPTETGTETAISIKRALKAFVIVITIAHLVRGH